MVLSDLFMTSGRYRLVDMPYPWYQGPARFLIPVSDARLNFASVLKPFQLPVQVAKLTHLYELPCLMVSDCFSIKVWILLIVSVVFLVATFEMIKHYLPVRDSNVSDIDDVTQRRSNRPIPYLYVFGLLLSQGKEQNVRINGHNFGVNRNLISPSKPRRSNNIKETSHSTGGRHLVFSRFRSQPGLQFYTHHLRHRSQQSSANQLRHGHHQ